MTFKVEMTETCKKQFNKLDNSVKNKIGKWIKTNLENCTNPKICGKPLQGKLSKYWRYRVGDYRIIAEINYDTIIILITYINHRKDAYKIKEDFLLNKRSLNKNEYNEFEF